MTNVTNSCILTFSTSLGKNRTISFKNPVEGLDAMTVLDAAIEFASADPFDDTIGSLEGLVRAEVVSTTKTVLFGE